MTLKKTEVKGRGKSFKKKSTKTQFYHQILKHLGCQ